MSTAEAVAFETVADLLEQLGVPAERVLLRPPPGEATESDLLGPKLLCELIDGVLVRKAMGWKESHLASILSYFLQCYLDQNPLGMVLGEGGMIRLFPGSVRLPDVSFVSWERMREAKSLGDQILRVVPELAVEVLSPSNTKREMQRKRKDYFAGGCILVWEADPRRRTVEVFTSPEESVVLGEDGILEGAQILPGFRLSIREWFARAEGPMA